MQKISCLLAAAALGIFPASAGATTIAVDFDSVAVQGLVTDNLITQGFNFSPNCHYDVLGTPAAGYWLGYDAAGCFAGGSLTPNPNFLGPTSLQFSNSQNPNVYITASGGSPFSLLGITNMRSPWRIESSNGGLFTPGELTAGIPESFSFIGAQWENLSWLLVSGGRGGEPVGFDNVVLELPSVSVPIPNVLSLGFLALLGLGTNRRRPKQ
jgi:hypothetical protein